MERLYGMRKKQIDKTDKAKEDYEFEKQSAECTFAPNLSRKPARPKKVSEAVASERQQKTMQKQLERLNKAREEKERIKKMTERGIPKTKRPAVQLEQQEEKNEATTTDTLDHVVVEQVGTTAPASQRPGQIRPSFKSGQPGNASFQRGTSQSKLSSSMIGSGLTATPSSSAIKHKRLGINPLPKQNNFYQMAAASLSYAPP